jgi:hypothetical protein
VELSKETQARVIAVLAAPDLNAVSLGEEHMFTAAETIVWVAAAGLEVAARVAAEAGPMTNPNNITPVVSRVCAASKAGVQYGDVSAGKFLKGFLFSGGPMSKLESVRGKAKTTKKRAPPSGAPAGASMDAPLDLESDPPVAKKPYNILHEASYAMDAPGGDPAPSWPHPPPSSAHFQPQGNLMCFCARMQLRRVRVDFICENVTHYDLRFRHVCSLPGVAVQLLSQSPHLVTPRVSSTRLPEAPLRPFHSSLFFSPIALVIVDAVSFRNGV